MKQLISTYKLTERASTGLYSWVTNGEIIVLGKYEEGETFAGGDRLSMGIMASNELVKPKFDGKIVICEGDRFSNSTFLRDFNPIIIKIRGDGAAGRKNRESQQTERHIKSILTRVNNILPDHTVNDSSEAFALLKSEIANPILTNTNRPGTQTGLF